MKGKLILIKIFLVIFSIFINLILLPLDFIVGCNDFYRNTLIKMYSNLGKNTINKMEKLHREQTAKSKEIRQ